MDAQVDLHFGVRRWQLQIFSRRGSNNTRAKSESSDQPVWQFSLVRICAGSLHLIRKPCWCFYSTCTCNIEKKNRVTVKTRRQKRGENDDWDHASCLQNLIRIVIFNAQSMLPKGCKVWSELFYLNLSSSHRCWLESSSGHSAWVIRCLINGDIWENAVIKHTGRNFISAV